MPDLSNNKWLYAFDLRHQPEKPSRYCMFTRDTKYFGELCEGM